jgi:phosphoglucosamine mutase
VIFREFLSTGDGLLSALQVLAAVRAAGRPLSVLTSLAAPYPHVMLNLPVKERRPLESLKGFEERRRSVEADLGSTGRSLIRYSGTEPLLRIYLEGPDRDRLLSHAAALAEPFRAAGLTAE